jgi:methyl-accepting chemotaxis protein
MNMQIASAAEEQNSVSSEINRNIHNIGQVTEQTSQGVQESTALCGEVIKESKQLQTLMKKFRV